MGRLFILGAGSSVYAGFPLGKDLWDFLIDHCGPLGSAMETVSAYLSTLDADHRLEATRDLELTLTNLETGAIKPMPAGDLYRSKGKRWDLAEKQALRSKLRHTLQNEPRFNYNDYWDSQRIRRSSPVTAWRTRVQLHSLQGPDRRFRRRLPAPSRLHLVRSAPLPWHRRAVAGGQPAILPASLPVPPDLKIGQVHDVFAAIGRHFRPGDTVVTFNYDATVEASLWERGLWHFADGYGFPIANRSAAPEALCAVAPAVSGDGPEAAWFGQLGEKQPRWRHRQQLSRPAVRPAGVQHLSVPTSTRKRAGKRGTPRTRCSPPTYMKDYAADPTLSLIWDRIETAVATATEISVVGYSLPKGDKAARGRLGAALQKNAACRAVTIVSPGERARSEWPAFLDAAGKHVDWRTGTFDAWIGEGRR